MRMTIRGVLGGIGCAILTLFGILVIVSIISMALTGKAHAQTPHWRDRDSIAAAISRVDTDSVHLSLPAALALAWEESGGNDSMPALRGHHCWYSVTARADTIWEQTQNGWPRVARRNAIDTIIVRPRHVHHEKNCEVGRFQIKPSTAKLRCPAWNVFTYGGNLACFAQMFAEDTKHGGTLYAIRHHNGSGKQADEYLQRVLRTIGWLTVEYS